MAPELRIEWLGRVPYREALELQEKRVEARLLGATGDALLLLEHPPVVTLGRSAKPQNLRLGRDGLAARGIAVHSVRRGGDVTYHGPGQLVGYPILDLEARGAPDVHRYLRDLEFALVDALDALGVRARAIDGYTGVYVDPGPGDTSRKRKLASIGVGVRRWVTYHGFALNVTLDPRAFDPIVPCGLDDVDMTSVARELARGAEAAVAPDLDVRARAAVAAAFERCFG